MPRSHSSWSITLLGVCLAGTELGDVLATSGLDFLQGIEEPQENSTTVDSHCGQAATLTFYAELLDHPAPEPPQPLPAGNGAGAPWTKNLTDGEFRHTWSFRRAFCKLFDFHGNNLEAAIAITRT